MHISRPNAQDFVHIQNTQQLGIKNHQWGAENFLGGVCIPPVPPLGVAARPLPVPPGGT